MVSNLLCKILYTLWFIWKARNDYHFNRKEWTPPQVHQAVQAYMTYNEHNPPQSSTQSAQPPGIQISVLQESTQNQEAPPHFCPYPASLQDSRCYVDVAVVPDNQNINTNNAFVKKTLTMQDYAFLFSIFRFNPLKPSMSKRNCTIADLFSWVKQQLSLLEQLSSKLFKSNPARFFQIPSNWCTSSIRSNKKTLLSGESNLLRRLTLISQPSFRPISSRSTEDKTQQQTLWLNRP